MKIKKLRFLYRRFPSLIFFSHYLYKSLHSKKRSSFDHKRSSKSAHAAFPAATMEVSMYHFRNLAIAAIAAPVILAGCSSTQDSSAANLSAVSTKADQANAEADKALALAQQALTLAQQAAATAKQASVTASATNQQTNAAYQRTLTK